MVPVLAPLLLPLGLGAALVLSHEVALRAEVRHQEFRSPAGAATLTEAAELQPSIGLRGVGRDGALSADYQPRLTVLRTDAGDENRWLHVATFSGAWRPGGTLRTGASGRLTYGVVNLLRLDAGLPAPGEPPPAIRPVPANSVVEYEQLALDVSAEGQPWRRWLVGGVLGAGMEAGLGTADRELIPLQRSVRAAGSLLWQLDRTTSLGWSSAADLIRFIDVAAGPAPPGGAAERLSWWVWTGRLAATVRGAPSRETSLWASAGAGFGGGERPGQPALGVEPAGELGASRRGVGQRSPLEAGTALTLGPVENRVLGTLEQRCDLRAWLAWSAASRLSLRAAASAGLRLGPPEERDGAGAAEASAAFAAAEWAEISLGARGSLTRTPSVATRPSQEWAVYLALLLTHHGRR